MTCVIFRGLQVTGALETSENAARHVSQGTSAPLLVGLASGMSREQAFHPWPEHSRFKLEGSPGPPNPFVSV